MTTQSHDHAHTPSKRSGVPIIAATLFATLALPTLTTTPVSYTHLTLPTSDLV